MTKKKIYVHIGWHKTGSTSIQDLLLKNRKTLREDHKVYYPHEGMLSGAHHLIAWAFQNKKNSPWGAVEIPEGGPEQFIRNIRVSADNNRCERVIVSTEEFCTFNKTEIQALHAALLKSNFDAEIVAYIRRQDQLIESSYNMEVKWWGSRITKDFPSYVREKNPYFNYAQMIDEWASFFGVGNVNIRVFDPEKMVDGDVRIDFCDSLKIDWHMLEVTKERVNDSLASWTIEFLRVINNLDIPHDVHGEIVERLFEYDRLKRSPKCIFFTPEERIDFMRALDDSNKSLEKYSNRVNFRLPPKGLLPEKNVRPLSPEEFEKLYRFAMKK